MTTLPSRPLLALALLLNTAVSTATVDPIDLSLEELTQVRIVSTPKFAENPDRIPSVVSILNAEDIRLYGWRTLGDALRTLQGFNVTEDHTYAFAGLRGISQPGDYRPRMQILIDGMSINENLYGSAAVDSTFPLDIGLIDRIEVIRGPSAAVYGGDAMFGVINVVTRTGSSLAGGEAALQLGSGLNRRLRASWGGQVGGHDTLVSVTGFEANGLRLAFADVNGDGSSRTLNRLDGEDGGQLFFKMRGDDWNIAFMHARRQRNVPTASYDTIADDTGHREADRYTTIDLGKTWKLAPHNTLLQRLYFGSYGYEGMFPYDYSGATPPAPVTPRAFNIDRADGSWWGFENRLVNTSLASQRWTIGLEYRANVRQNQVNFDRGYGCIVDGAPPTAAPCLDDHRHSHQVTLMVQDEIQVADTSQVVTGLRYDSLGGLGSFWSPRLGLVHDAGRAGLFKLLYGTAFRTPTVYERFYAAPTLVYGNPALEPEKMRSLEFSWEKRLGSQARLSTTVYRFHIDRMTTLDSNGMAINGTPAKATGLETEYEQRWTGGTRLRTGYSLQYAADETGRFDNSPRHMAKLNLAAPIGLPSLTAGFEGQWVGSRLANRGANRVAAYALANLNLRYAPAGRAWDTAFGIYNLFDRRYDDPVALDEVAGVRRWYMPQHGRTVMLQASLRF